jgi:hypothetical protein
VNARRRMDLRNMSNELHVNEADLRYALPVLARKVTKLAKLYIDHMASNQAERASRLQDHLNTFEPVEGMHLAYRVPPTHERVLPTYWGRFGTGIVDGFIPGETELPYEEREIIPIYKECNGEQIQTERVRIILNPAMFQIAQEKSEMCPTCNEHPLGGKRHDGTTVTECGYCRKVERFVPMTTKEDLARIKAWEG